MSPETFDRLASRTRMRERALAAARRYLVDGVTNAAAVAREMDLQPQTVRDAVARIQRELRLESGTPPDWVAVTVVVPPEESLAVLEIQRRAWRRAGLVTE